MGVRALSHVLGLPKHDLPIAAFDHARALIVNVILQSAPKMEASSAEPKIDASFALLC